jgi:hypothetical protein
LASGLQTAHEAFSRGLRARWAAARYGGLTGSPTDRLLMINTEPCS